MRQGFDPLNSVRLALRFQFKCPFVKQGYPYEGTPLLSVIKTHVETCKYNVGQEMSRFRSRRTDHSFVKGRAAVRSTKERESSLHMPVSVMTEYNAGCLAAQHKRLSLVKRPSRNTSNSLTQPKANCIRLSKTNIWQDSCWISGTVVTKQVQIRPPFCQDPKEAGVIPIVVITRLKVVINQVQFDIFGPTF